MKISKQKETKKILFKEAIRIVFINQSVIIMLFTTRKETAKKMPIYPLKKIKLNPKKKKMVHVELDLGQDQPSLTSEMLEGIGILGGATPN